VTDLKAQILNFGFIDKKITDVLKAGKFTLSAEMIPPRNGEPFNETLRKLSEIVGSGFDFLSVTKGAGGSLRGGSLPIAQLIKDQFARPCIAHFTCRDLSPQEIENQLIDHHYFGVRNILALRGDPPLGDKDWQPHKDGYSFAYQLIEQIKKLNNGVYLERSGFKVADRESTDFCIGAAIYPEHPNKKECFDFAQYKFDAGAEYGITQMLFNPDIYLDFCNELTKKNVSAPIIPGVRILSSKKQAHIMETRFGCSVPNWYKEQLPDTHESEIIDMSVISPFLELVNKLKSNGAPGIHIFVLNDVELCSQAMQQLKKTFS
jgi:methylenetetrahydrofolate reductase (NADPH)